MSVSTDDGISTASDCLIGGLSGCDNGLCTVSLCDELCYEDILCGEEDCSESCGEDYSGGGEEKPEVGFTIDVTVTGPSSVDFDVEYQGSDSTTSTKTFRYIRIVITDPDGDEAVNDEIKANIRSGKSTWNESYSGLKPKTRYDWVITLGYIDTNTMTEVQWLGVEESYHFTTDNILLAPWDWFSSNGEATAEQTETAYNVLLGTISVKGNFSHIVWNDFVDKVMEMRTHVGDGTWDRQSGKYLSYNECKVEAGDTLSADIYNSVKVQIGSVIATDILDVSLGDKLTGYNVIHIADILNDIIVSL